MNERQHGGPRTVVARHYETTEWVRLFMEGSEIAHVEPAAVEPQDAERDVWLGPAFWDIQTNGRWGISFADPNLTVDQVASIVRAQAALGTARLCPTLITAPQATLRHGLATIAAACEQDRDVDAMVAGIHLEGPAISSVDGFRGAHPFESVRDPSWDEFQELQDASGGRIRLVTLAPERNGAIEFIERVSAQGVTVALGHTAADGETIRAAVQGGARLSTHLGNGAAALLPRHPNPIWEQAACDELWASLIADGHHVGPAALKVLVRAKTPARIILVSDASPLAGLPPGRYGEWAVDPSGKIVVAGTPYLAGSNQGIDVGINHLMHDAGLSLREAIDTATRHPARLLGRREPTLERGQPANLILFRYDAGAGLNAFQLRATCVLGRWTEERDPSPPAEATGFATSS